MTLKVEDDFAKFNDAMDAILRADPKAVKKAMEDEKHANADRRKQTHSKKESK